ncbi:MAG: hypothetical protein B7X31_10690 [Thiomonas sp. 13-66-29]|jgi:diaminopimelate decarboxylase|nr:MAG: hypothetical protein B7X31_10690 [Thiomonas sp. 13-66-29]
MDLQLDPRTRDQYLELAAQFGTPLYVYDGDAIAARYRLLRDGLPPEVNIYYSLKANPNVGVCALLGREGAGAEVSSLAELMTAEWAGVAMQDTIFLGPGKSEVELQACVAARPRAVIVESLQELAALERLAAAARTQLDILLRVNPAAASRNRGLSMGGKPRQFGIDEEIVLACANVFHALQWLRLRGLHVFFGTRFLDSQEIVINTERIFDLVETFEAQIGLPVDLVDIGGGFGVAYYSNETDLDISALLPALSQTIRRFLNRHPGTRVITEQGRYLTAESGVFLTRVRYTKHSLGQAFAVVDGGTNHHLSAVGVGNVLKKDFPLVSLADPGRRDTVPVTVAGPLCTPSDVLATKVALPQPKPGDVLAVLRSGAYGSTASPGLFLGHGYPAEVLIANGAPYLVRRRDTIDDVLAGQLLPASLAPSIAAHIAPSAHSFARIL